MFTIEFFCGKKIFFIRSLREKSQKKKLWIQMRLCVIYIYLENIWNRFKELLAWKTLKKIKINKNFCVKLWKVVDSEKSVPSNRKIVWNKVLLLFFMYAFFMLGNISMFYYVQIYIYNLKGRSYVCNVKYFCFTFFILYKQRNN